MDWVLAKTEASKVTPEGDGKPKGRLHTCGKCKTVFRGNYCTNCGTPASKADPYVCKKCGEQYRGPQCPKCGYQPERAAKNVRMKKGELEERRRTALRDATPDDKQRYWDKCVGIAIGKRTKIGSAAHLYREKYGVWPNNELRGVPRGKMEWNLSARDYYQDVIAPMKHRATCEVYSPINPEGALT